MDGDCDYLSATLELTESVVPEEKTLKIMPRFNTELVEINFDDSDESEDTFLVLNRRQIECLVDFLGAWLKRLDARQSKPPQSNRSAGEAQ
jgi:cob(I)alamin adenosyltransferase